MRTYTCLTDQQTWIAFPKESLAEGSFLSPMQTQLNRLTNCHPVNFMGKPSVNCEGTEADIIVIPHLPSRPLEQRDSVIMLGVLAL